MQLNESTRRLKWLLAGLLCWSGLLFGRLVWLQVVRHESLSQQAENQQQRVIELPALRGSILDRTGQPLAKTLEADSVVVDPQKLKNIPEAAFQLAGALDLDVRQLRTKIEASKLRGSHFLWVERKLTPQMSKRVHALKKFEGLEFRKEMRRYYPRTTLAAALLGATGFVKADDVSERGNAGVEMSLEKDLGGKSGEARIYTDSRQNSYDQDVLRQPEPGADITLTIDPNLQFRAEQELAAGVAASGADGGSVVAIDPYTGEILAMASYPTFDPNVRPDGPAAMKARQNSAVSRTFEPGSVYKVITLAAALEKTQLTPDSIIDCGNGKINLFGRVIHDHDSYSSLSMAGVLAHSSNIGAIRIAMATGSQNFYEYQKLFGFGQKTGIGLPGESGGILWPVEKWTKSSIGSLAMGHEIGVTALQVARAGSVIANGGLMVKPRLVMSKQRPKT